MSTNKDLALCLILLGIAICLGVAVMNGDNIKQDMSDAAMVKAEREQIALTFPLVDMFKPAALDDTTPTPPETVISGQSREEESTQEHQPDARPATNNPTTTTEATDGKSAANGGKESAVQAFARQHNTLPVGIRPEGLPEGRFKTQLMRLPLAVQDAVVAVLIEQKTPVIDLECMHIDENGQIVNLIGNKAQGKPRPPRCPLCCGS